MDMDRFILSLDLDEQQALTEAIRLHNARGYAATDEEIALLRRGRRVQAIKAIRDRLNTSLSMAKDYADHWSHLIEKGQLP